MGLGRSITTSSLEELWLSLWLTIVVTAVFAERAFDHTTGALWDRMRRRKLWDYLKGEIEGQEED